MATMIIKVRIEDLDIAREDPESVANEIVGAQLARSGAYDEWDMHDVKVIEAEWEPW